MGQRFFLLGLVGAPITLVAEAVLVAIRPARLTPPAQFVGNRLLTAG